VFFWWAARNHFFDFSAERTLAAALAILQALVERRWFDAMSFTGWALILFPLMIIVRTIYWFEYEGRQSYAGNAVNDATLRNFLFEMLLVGFLGFFLWFLVGNAVRNLAEANIASGFAFLNRNSGFAINQSPFIPYSEASSYGMVYWVGLQNTLVVAITGIVLATILGFIIGIARLSKNWIVSRLAYAYVEIMRNIPLLLWIFIWYFSVLRLLPDKQAPLDFGPLGFLSIAGYYMPKPVFGQGAGWIGWALLAGIAVSIVISVWARNRQQQTGEQFPVLWAAVGLIVGLPLLAWFGTGMPVGFEYPVASKFGTKGGIRIFPEFMGLTVALVTYTASYIAEIVRAGILAVHKGQTEAAHALGLRHGTALRLVIVPQAMRVIIPPLTNQFLNITKNSSLAVAIAYPDLVATFMGTALNQTGQAVEIILMTMLTYLTLSLVTSFFMNIYNSRIALVER
jgi:general L-amino acid transport system permease protein